MLYLIGGAILLVFGTTSDNRHVLIVGLAFLVGEYVLSRRRR